MYQFIYDTLFYLITKTYKTEEDYMITLHKSSDVTF